MELSQLLKLSRDRDISPDFTAKLMTTLLQHERDNAMSYMILGMKTGWMIGTASASQTQTSAKTRKVYTYTDYINRDRPQRIVCYDASRSEYIEIPQHDEK